MLSTAFMALINRAQSFSISARDVARNKSSARSIRVNQFDRR